MHVVPGAVNLFHRPYLVNCNGPYLVNCNGSVMQSHLPLKCNYGQSNKDVKMASPDLEQAGVLPWKGPCYMEQP